GVAPLGVRGDLETENVSACETLPASDRTFGADAMLGVRLPIFAQVRAAQVRAVQVRAAQVRAAQVRAAQVRAVQVRAAQVRAVQVRAAQVRAVQVRAHGNRFNDNGRK